MTDIEWLTCDDPKLMLDVACNRIYQFPRWRKLQMFGIACCREILPMLLTHSPLLEHQRRSLRATVEPLDIAERYFDGASDESDVIRAYSLLIGLLSGRVPEEEPWSYFLVASLRAISITGCRYSSKWEIADDSHREPRRCALDAADFVITVAAWMNKSNGNDSRRSRLHQADLVRDIFGDPFQPASIKADRYPPKVVDLARAIYDARAFERLPELATLLVAEGYDEPNVLEHCRKAGRHVRGCWVVDLILQKD